MGERVPTVDSTILGLTSFTPPTFILPFEPPDKGAFLVFDPLKVSILGVTQGFYRDHGKENGNDYSI